MLAPVLHSTEGTIDLSLDTGWNINGTGSAEIKAQYTESMMNFLPALTDPAFCTYFSWVNAYA